MLLEIKLFFSPLPTVAVLHKMYEYRGCLSAIKLHRLIFLSYKTFRYHTECLKSITITTHRIIKFMVKIIQLHSKMFYLFLLNKRIIEIIWYEIILTSVLPEPPSAGVFVIEDQ